MLGAITHLLYRFRMERHGVPGISDVLTELSKPGVPWRKVVEKWQEYPHLGYREGEQANGKTLIPLVHPVVAQEAQSILNKPDEEAGSVLSTVISNMGLFRDPVVARNTSKSSFRIRDLMNHDDPVSCYLVINPNDQLRLMPLTRLVLTQIIFTLAARMDFKDGRSAEAYKHRLLLLLDEFPSLGRMDLFERALGFIGDMASSPTSWFRACRSSIKPTGRMRVSASAAIFRWRLRRTTLKHASICPNQQGK
jgi:type IV secretion system protein VirD4